MTSATQTPASCGVCAFWRKLRETEGVCCRWAPESARRAETVAHWPLTRRIDRCGDGVVADRFSLGAYCADCIHWRRPEQGLNPLNRGDMPMAWWARAGHCMRHAPRAVQDPGPRGFWPATLDIDFCGEGAPRDSDPK